MKLDITKILTSYSDNMKIDSQIEISKEYLDKSLICDLKNTKLIGEILLNEDNELLLTGTISGTMILKDDLTLEPVEYDFNTEIEEIFEKYENILDITDILWQNILVEIPSKVRGTDEDVTLKGNGWRVISEEQYEKERNKINNPFSELNELLSTKEDR